MCVCVTRDSKVFLTCLGLLCLECNLRKRSRHHYHACVSIPTYRHDWLAAAQYVRMEMVLNPQTHTDLTDLWTWHPILWGRHRGLHSYFRLSYFVDIFVFLNIKSDFAAFCWLVIVEDGPHVRIPLSNLSVLRPDHVHFKYVPAHNRRLSKLNSHVTLTELLYYSLSNLWYQLLIALSSTDSHSLSFWRSLKGRFSTGIVKWKWKCPIRPMHLC